MSEQEKQDKKEKKEKKPAAAGADAGAPAGGEAKPQGKGGGEKKGGGGDRKGGGEKKGRKQTKGPAAAEEQAEDDAPAQPAPPARLYERFKTEIAPALKDKLGLKNTLAVPRLEKIVISMGLGRFATEGGEGKAKFQQAEKELAVIAGQKPLRCKAKKSVANFKVREGMETGIKVTLRGARMYEFLDRMISLAFPRVKDFRGIDPAGFDRNGNYNFGFTEQTVFPEVEGANVNFQQGMNITVVTTARKAEHGRELLKMFGMPFREDGKKQQQ
jgi:large subunit ribosomal protein L5